MIRKMSYGNVLDWVFKVVPLVRNDAGFRGELMNLTMVWLQVKSKDIFMGRNFTEG